MVIAYYSAWRKPGFFIEEVVVSVEKTATTEATMQSSRMPEPNNRKIL